MNRTILLLATIIFWPATLSAQDCHGRSGDMDHRGHTAMGFSQEKSKHTFLLYRDGGLISAKATDAADAATRDQIRAHMKEIEKLFAAGDFDKPQFIHGKVPPGAETMKAQRSAISYRYRELPNGGGVRITTSNQSALAAIHSFLRFQIEDHKTGDPTQVVEER
jgi:hypothetical protein